MKMTTTEYQLILKMVKSFVEELKENSLILTRGVILLSCCTNVPIIKLLLASKSIYNGGILLWLEEQNPNFYLAVRLLVCLSHVPGQKGTFYSYGSYRTPIVHPMLEVEPTGRRGSASDQSRRRRRRRRV